ncbi:predicted protein [Pyrenophora tritici-repentis Pt-1C-BFP]|uniref:Uncharacterized protein n=1 Tax=Pyrenophora tritici-repentis (strain Pt-1C-BFP) TaxID=426418 RepID=B2VVM3_PYRTR|nr:uncharacterized protein PTRG_01235 [Pyrenophora tritici-repentis Pt-1C-BFP]EDU40673.1 predicted protein [Pyrenophora tritici-repentis Pt-1C-BFP]
MTALMSVSESILASPRVLLESAEDLQKSADDLMAAAATTTQSVFTLASLVDPARSSSEYQLPENERNNLHGQVLIPDLSGTLESPSGDTDTAQAHQGIVKTVTTRRHQENTDNSGTAASQAMDDVYGDSTDRDEGFYEE